MERKTSLFSQLLRKLIVDAGIMTRADWCDTLGIRSPSISQWFSDETIPRPETLRAIIKIAERSASNPRVNEHALRQFFQLSTSPAEQVSPHGKRMGTCLSDYGLRPRREGVFSILKSMPWEEQEAICDLIANVCSDEQLVWRWKEKIEAPSVSIHEQFPEKALLRRKDLVSIFGGQSWNRIDVIGSSPLEFSEQPVEQQATYRDLVHSQFQNRCGEDRRLLLHYYLPFGFDKEHLDRALEHLLSQETNRPEVRVIVTEIEPNVLQQISSRFPKNEGVFSLAVGFNLDDRHTRFGYSWYRQEVKEKEPPSFGIRLSQDALDELSNTLEGDALHGKIIKEEFRECAA